ncbi:MAG: 2-amino-4-hydroxy-6-hydroxymethyldihydropteridine diphosphokinase [Acidimicrobiales bacterium]
MVVIEVRGLRALGRHGALPGEQDQPQPFEVELDVEVAAGRTAALTDALVDTVDYGALVRLATAVIVDERWQLLERLARRIAEEVIAADRLVQGVTVVVRKLRPPVPVDLESAGVRLRLARRRAFLGLGVNLGDREAALVAAVAGLPDVAAVSPVYETEPVGGPPGQPPYLNVVVGLSTVLTAHDLLVIGQALEGEAGRDRTAEERNGPRPLDVDVLWVQGETVDSPPDLVVPHPRMWERRFVLAPLRDVAPDLVPDGALETATGNVRLVGRL